ncbi:MAG: zinc-dependent metalloprotease [Flavobacteriaceae bacterium]
MKKTCLFLLLNLFTLSVFGQFFNQEDHIESYTGFFDFYYDSNSDKIYLAVDKLDTDFLYVSALSEGLGSNDIGLDRGQLGGGVVVHFEKRGDKLLLVQDNQDYRAITDNQAERKSIKEAFAKSILYGFKVEKEENGVYLVDATSFLIRDEHGVSNRLGGNNQGSFSLDKSRSAFNLNRTKAFENNVEFDAYLTFKGRANGRALRSVSPDASSITVAQHHSFVKLPEDGFEPRKFDPRASSNFMSFMDYSTPVDEPIVKRYINRHRLEKKDPTAEKSEAVNSIIYYLDPGTPEPVRSALLEGASWWNQAFEAAGYINAFQVKMLPEDVDPLDTRYNVIQWVHRSTRGWSYGASISDPRTGEIIKGHVSLGSLRIRQDYLIGNALTANGDQAMEMALARIRQLSAHEVGHTLGFSHNFAASSNGRASVMDYPHPMIRVKDNKIDLSQAYDTGIGEWDKIATKYAYGDYSEKELNQILLDATTAGYRFISDSDARAPGGAHAYAHLWDNGKDPIEEMKEVEQVRSLAMKQFSTDVIKSGTPYSELEDAFAPVYFYHRYQTEALSKLVGGLDYSYQVKDGGQENVSVISANIQKQALQGLLLTLDPEFLSIPEQITNLFPPRAFGYYRSRESFKGHTGVAFDPMAAAATSADFSLSFLLNKQRLARLVEQHGVDKSNLGLSQVLDELLNQTLLASNSTSYNLELRTTINFVVMDHLYKLTQDNQMPQVQAQVWNSINQVEIALLKRKSKDLQKIYDQQVLRDIEQVKSDFSNYKFKVIAKMPDGSPI